MLRSHQTQSKFYGWWDFIYICFTRSSSNIQLKLNIRVMQCRKSQFALRSSQRQRPTENRWINARVVFTHVLHVKKLKSRFSSSNQNKNMKNHKRIGLTMITLITMLQVKDSAERLRWDGHSVHPYSSLGCSRTIQTTKDPISWNPCRVNVNRLQIGRFHDSPQIWAPGFTPIPRIPHSPPTLSMIATQWTLMYGAWETCERVNLQRENKIQLPHTVASVPYGILNSHGTR